MAKARQVGTPQAPQLVLGSSLNISMPVNAMSLSLPSAILASIGD
jgi:hypothetical protein